MIEPCPRRDRWIRGCKFEERYDLGAPAAFHGMEGSAGMVLQVLEASKPLTYVRDICVVCGRTVER